MKSMSAILPKGMAMYSDQPQLPEPEVFVRVTSSVVVHAFLFRVNMVVPAYFSAGDGLG